MVHLKIKKEGNSSFYSARRESTNNVKRKVLTSNMSRRHKAGGCRGIDHTRRSVVQI